ncbi:MAG: alpha-isopropylmalate synthase regulatory domain-containing protein [Hyphomicrobiales bacterium]
MKRANIAPGDAREKQGRVREIELQTGNAEGTHPEQVLKARRGLELPPRFAAEFAETVRRIADATTADRIWTLFEKEYLDGGHYGYVEHVAKTSGGGQAVTAKVTVQGKPNSISGTGNGPLNAFIAAMAKETGLDLELADYREHIIGTGANADVAAYVALTVGGRTAYGVGIDKSMATASMKAVVSSVNRMLRAG